MTVLSKNTVVVAMSGGVDSSVAAFLLKEQGMEVIGISMKTHETALDEVKTGGTCCTAYDINDARIVCQQLDIPFYPLNFTEDFEEKVIQNFVEEYAKGRTPNPCVQCNDQLKFSALLTKARQLGAYYLATGHYVRKNRDRNGKYHLIKARDAQKDQSYFLFGLGQDQLEHVLFPVGKYLKSEVRELAQSAGLKTADKEESQEICFIPDHDAAKFVHQHLPTHPGSGNFVNQQGQVVGEHSGFPGYTIGQRRGLGVATGERAYVTEIVPEENKVILGSKADLLKQGLIAKGLKWVHREAVSSGMEVDVKIRSRHPGAAAIIRLEDHGQMVQVDFKEPQSAITPGQVAVFYLGEEVLGGGFIEKGLP